MATAPTRTTAANVEAIPAGTWTQDDERNFQAMQQRRDAVVGQRERALADAASVVWGAVVNTGPDSLHNADRARCVGALTEALRDRAYGLRAALEPFDFGPPPAPAEPPSP